MKIETKLNIADDAYFMFHNKIQKASIDQIKIMVDAAGYYRVDYKVDKNPAGAQYTDWFSEHEIFGNKEQLLNSLV